MSMEGQDREAQRDEQGCEGGAIEGDATSQKGPNFLQQSNNNKMEHASRLPRKANWSQVLRVEQK